MEQMTNKAKRAIDNLDTANFSLIEINKNGNPVILVATPKPRQKFLLYSGMPDTMFTINENGCIGLHGWLPYSSDNKFGSNSFTFALDPTFTVDMKSKSLRMLPGVWSPHVEKTSQLFVYTSDGKLVICCGFWDNSIRALNWKGKVVSHIYQHLDVVTCLAMDPSGHYFISGSRDLTCMIWKITYHSGLATDVNKKPLQTLYGHDDDITSAAMIWELDMAVSGSKDGTCILHTIRKGQYLRTLRPASDPERISNRIICQICLSKYGRIVVNSKQVEDENAEHLLSVFSINGKLLSTITCSEVITDMMIIDEKLVTGGKNGTLTVRDVYDIEKPILAKNVRASIRSVFATSDGSHIFATRDDGTVIVVCPKAS